jgi:hypothetical protein
MVLSSVCIFTAPAIFLHYSPFQCADLSFPARAPGLGPILGEPAQEHTSRTLVPARRVFMVSGFRHGAERITGLVSGACNDQLVVNHIAAADFWSLCVAA